MAVDAFVRAAMMGATEDSPTVDDNHSLNLAYCKGTQSTHEGINKLTPRSFLCEEKSKEEKFNENKCIVCSPGRMSVIVPLHDRRMEVGVPIHCAGKAILHGLLSGRDGWGRHE